MSKGLFALALTAVLFTVASPRPAAAAVSDLPGMATANSMQEWMKLSDDQVAKLVPVIETRVEKVDAALAKAEAAEKPDVLGFVEEYGKIKKEFDAGVTGILTPDQLKQWGSFKAEAEKSVVQAGARRKLEAMQPKLALTDEQVTTLEPAMTVATQKKLDVLQKLASAGNIGVRDKLKAKRAMGDANGELEKAMAAVMSPDQLKSYKAGQEEMKKKLKGK